MSLVQKVPQALSSLPVAADTVLSLASSTPSKLSLAILVRYSSRALLFFSISVVEPL
jgi:hypothetical protein